MLTGEVPANAGVVTFNGGHHASVRQRAGTQGVRQDVSGRTDPSVQQRPGEPGGLRCGGKGAADGRDSPVAAAPVGTERDDAMNMAGRISLLNKMDTPARFLSHGDRKRAGLQHHPGPEAEDSDDG